MGTKVEVRGLRKEYPSGEGKLVVLDDFDLVIEPGEALAVTGPSGCGKSTLLHILGTLDRPTSGEVLLGGQDPFRLDDRALSEFRNRHVGFVFQDHYLLPQLTVLENVLVPTLVAKGETSGRREVVARARDLLERVGLSARVDHRPGALSGGERQRAAVARSLVTGPGLLLCDEPTGNLDEANARRIGDLLLELPAAEGSTLVVVTHSLELADRFARNLRLRAHGSREGEAAA